MRFFGTLAICALLVASAISEHTKHHHHARHHGHHGHHAKHHVQARADPVNVNFGGSAPSSPGSFSTTAGGSGARVPGNTYSAGSFSISTPRANLMYEASMDFYSMYYPETSMLYVFRPDRNLAGVFNTLDGKAIIFNTENGNAVFAPALSADILDRINKANSQDLPGAVTVAAVQVNNIGEAVYGNNMGPGAFKSADLVNAMKANTITDATTNQYINSLAAFLDQLKNMPYKTNGDYIQDFVEPMIIYMGYLRYSIDTLKDTQISTGKPVAPGQIIHVPTPNYIPSGQMPVVTKVVPVKEVVTVIRDRGQAANVSYNQYVDYSMNFNNSTINNVDKSIDTTQIVGSMDRLNGVVGNCLKYGREPFRHMMEINPAKYIKEGPEAIPAMNDGLNMIMNLFNPLNYLSMGTDMMNTAFNSMPFFGTNGNMLNPLNFIPGFGGMFNGGINGGVSTQAPTAAPTRQTRPPRPAPTAAPTAAPTPAPTARPQWTQRPQWQRPTRTPAPAPAPTARPTSRPVFPTRRPSWNGNVQGNVGGNAGGSLNVGSGGRPFGGQTGVSGSGSFGGSGNVGSNTGFGGSASSNGNWMGNGNIGNGVSGGASSSVGGSGAWNGPFTSSNVTGNAASNANGSWRPGQGAAGSAGYNANSGFNFGAGFKRSHVASHHGHHHVVKHHEAKHHGHHHVKHHEAKHHGHHHNKHHGHHHNKHHGHHHNKHHGHHHQGKHHHNKHHGHHGKHHHA